MELISTAWLVDASFRGAKGVLCRPCTSMADTVAAMRSRRDIPRRWFKPTEAAEYAKEQGYPEVTAEMIRANVRIDLLPAYAIGTGYFYRLRREDIDEWLDKHPWNRDLTYFRVNGRWIAELDSQG